MCRRSPKSQAELGPYEIPDVDAVYTYLQAKGIPSEKPQVAPYGMKQLPSTAPGQEKISASVVVSFELQ